MTAVKTLLVLALALCAAPAALACAPPLPQRDATGKVIAAPAPGYRYVFTAEVIGQKPIKVKTYGDTEIRALHVRVVESTNAQTKKGDTHALYHSDMDTTCRRTLVAPRLADFPVGSLVRVRTHDLGDAHIERLK